MPIVRGAVTSLLFAIAWMALVFHSRPALRVDTNDAAALQSSITDLKTWSFTPALLRASERSTYESAKTVPEATAALGAADAMIGARFWVAAADVLLAMAVFWGVIHMLAKKQMPATVVGVVIGPLLPCVVSMSLAGLLLSGPPLAAGAFIAAITLVSKRFQKSG